MSDMTLQAIMKLDTNQAQKALGDMHAKFTSSIKNMAAVAASAFGMSKVLEGAFNVVEIGAKLSQLSNRTGMTISDLAVLREAFETTGIGADEGTNSITRMQRSIGGINEAGEPTAKIFEQLGLNMNELKNMSPIDQLNKIGDAICELHSESERTTTAIAIFGRSGALMMQFFAEAGVIDKVTKSMGDLPDILSKNANLFKEIAENLTLIKNKSAGFFAGVMEGLAPALKSMTEFMDSINISEKGRALGEFFGTVMEAFKQGTLGEIIGLSLQVGFEKAMNWLFDKFISLIEIIGHGLANMIKAAISFSPDEVQKNFDDSIKQAKASNNSGTGTSASDQLAELWNQAKENYTQKITAAQEEANTPERTYGNKTLGSTSMIKSGFDISSDRLAKIGGFVGGGGPALDYAKRTATATEKMQKDINKLVNTNTDNVSAMQWK